MDRQLIHLDSNDLDTVIRLAGDGGVDVDTGALIRVLSKHLASVGLRIAVSNVDYLQHEDGAPEPDTRNAAGIWWLPKGDDTSLIGGFVIEGHALTIITEGEGESPLVEDVETVERATRAIASQHEGSEVLEPGLFKVLSPAREMQVRVVVTRDYRVRRPQDLLDAHELIELGEERLGLAIMQMVGGGKALLIKQGI